MCTVGGMGFLCVCVLREEAEGCLVGGVQHVWGVCVHLWGGCNRRAEGVTGTGYGAIIWGR